MNRERIGKLLTLRDSGANSSLGSGAKSKAFRDVRPDGGVVTQRTANPLPHADFRDSSHNSPSVPRIDFQGLSGLSANTAQGIEAGTDETPTAAQPEGQERGPEASPEHQSQSQRTHP
jgi:hypothetical protein